jgi:hypothetical protein
MEVVAVNAKANIDQNRAKAIRIAEFVPGFKLSYRIDEIVIATGFSRSRIYQHIARGELKTKKDGNTTVVLTPELVRFLNALPDGEIKPSA